MAEMMSPEQSAAFVKTMKMLFDALGHADNPNPKRKEAMVAVKDQVDAYKKEFDTEIEVNLGGEKII